MKQSNHLFAAFEKRFELAGKKWAHWMAQKEGTLSYRWRKAWLFVFVFLMISFLWLPLFFKSKPRVVDVGSINPPASIDRSDYQHKVRRMDYLIDSMQIKPSRPKDSLQEQVKLNSDTLN